MERSISDLLRTHRIPGLRRSQERHDAAEVVSRVLGIPLTAKQVTLDDGLLTLKVPPVAKALVRLRETDLKAALKERGLQVVSFR